MSDISANIKALRKSLKLRQEAFSAKICVPLRTLQDYERGISEPRATTIEKIAESCNIDIGWLITGKGEMRGGQKPEATIHIVTPEEGQRFLEENKGIDNFVSVPLIEERIAAGNPMFIENGDIEGYCVIYEKWARGKNLVCVRVKGESMHPNICDGSIVGIDLENNEIQEGKVFAVRYKDGCTIKRIFRDENYLILASDNPDQDTYKNMIINLEEAEYNPLIGKVVWAWSKFD